MLFNHLPKYLGTITGEPEDLRVLPQFLRADIDFAWRLGGPVVRSIISRSLFGTRWRHISVDSRLHMLMPGMWPAIPGWHCDDFYRPAHTSPNPDLKYVMAEAPSEHVALIFGDCSRTEYLNETLEWTPTPLEPGPMYQRADAFIRSQPRKTILVAPGELWQFSPLTWHQASRAITAGWRYFIRVTGSDHYQPLNELRTQTQVYLTEPFAGW